MIVRPIGLEEVEDFIQINPQIDETGLKEWKEFLQELWDRGESSIDLCFVVEQDGQFVGRIVCSSLPSQPERVHISGLYLPWSENFVQVGQELLEISRQTLISQKGEEWEYRLRRKDQPNHEAVKKFFRTMGFAEVQKKVRYEWEEQDFPTVMDRMAFKGMDMVGEGMVLDTWAKTLEGTLDREDRLQLRKLTKEKYAQRYMAELKDLHCRPGWWKVAYTRSKTPLGLVIPQRLTENTGVINYLGVVPTERGKGYSDSLLARGKFVLHSHGFEKVVADVDVENQPMRAALERSGFFESDQMTVYRRALEE